MGIIYTIIVGVLAGFLAGLVMKGKGFGFLINLIVGVAGAVIGSWIFNMLHIHIFHGFKGELLQAFIGAVVLLAIINVINKKE
jgi:uncharacterized membrane protein YeaQ/YmgE (transglycosylase-associated protein family)